MIVHIFVSNYCAVVGINIVKCLTEVSQRCFARVIYTKHAKYG
jgi:hypothetical protein